MKTMHWSKLYVILISIEVPYSDGARQGWDYDCQQYASLETLKTNMAEDFADPRMDRGTMMLHVNTNDSSYSAEVDITDLIGTDFVTLVFSTIEGMINGN